MATRAPLDGDALVCDLKEYARKLLGFGEEGRGEINPTAGPPAAKMVPNSWASSFVVWTTMVSNHLRSPHFGS